ncbi:signal peptide peptidase-like 2A isoform X4 [Varroa destructor]|uniref:Signal peptide peptidase-like 2B n=1 Tax=Varroa destructor TaxID=109461 RepID=A0A7M7IY69_VARDE|nr:signal peptide peptidase-like 2A isoform X4 [Varroa destructor]
MWIQFPSTSRETMCQVGFFLLCLCVVRGTATVAAPTGLHQGVIIIPSKKGVLCVEDNRRRVPSGTVPVYVLQNWTDLRVFLESASTSTSRKKSLLILYKTDADSVVSFLPLANVLRKSLLAEFAWLSSVDKGTDILRLNPIRIYNPLHGPSLDLLSKNATHPEGFVEVQVVAQTAASQTLALMYFCVIALLILGIGSAKMYLKADLPYIPGNRNVPLPCISRGNPIRLLFLAVPVTSAIVWYIHRTKYTQIWLLHNFMGSTMCIWLISLVRLPSLSVAVVIAVLLALYDFFMVYVTPLFTYDGKSVMEAVARGTNGEQMPMVLQMPPFTYGANYPECTGPLQGFIGMGDFIIPGFVVAYFGAFDAMCRREHWLKFTYLAMAAYVLGLLVTYGVKEIMNIPQPALVYIIPSLFIILIPAALISRVWHEVWTGDFLGNKKVSEKKE